MPVLLALLLSSIAFNITISWMAARGSKARLPLLIGVGVVVNIGVLVFFKYGRLLADLVPTDLSLLRLAAAAPLPIGISFYCIESVSLLVDIFRNRNRNEASFLRDIPWREAVRFLIVDFF